MGRGERGARHRPSPLGDVTSVLPSIDKRVSGIQRVGTDAACLSRHLRGSPLLAAVVAGARDAASYPLGLFDLGGQLRATPVSPLVVDGQRYIVGGLAEADWVKNARAAGWGILAHGRTKERIALIELPVEQRVPILRAFPREVPGGVAFFQRLYGLPKDRAALPDAFAALAPRCAVFRVEPASETRHEASA